jgi:hypothetical protein
MNNPLNRSAELASAASMAAELVTLLTFAAEHVAALPDGADFHTTNILNSADRTAEALHATLFRLQAAEAEGVAS